MKCTKTLQVATVLLAGQRQGIKLVARPQGTLLHADAYVSAEDRSAEWSVRDSWRCKGKVINRYPTDETVQKLYDERDFQRAVQLYLWASPLVSNGEVRRVLMEAKGAQYGDLIPLLKNHLELLV
jgi:hypothetical protein